MYFRTRLYELPVSAKIVLTGFAAAIGLAGALAISAFCSAFDDPDGTYMPSIRVMQAVIAGYPLHADQEHIVPCPEKMSPPLSTEQMAAALSLYFAIVSVAFVGLGLMFGATSLHERTKTFFASATFLCALAPPAFLWFTRESPILAYPAVVSAALLLICFATLSLVVLYDLWFRKPVA